MLSYYLKMLLVSLLSFLFYSDGIAQYQQIKKLIPFDGESDDQFGRYVAMSEDHIVVGSPFDDDNGSGSGSIYVYGRDIGGNDNWGLVKKIIPVDGGANDNFGFSVDLDGNTIIVGAMRDTDNGVLSGSAYIFEKDIGGNDNWGLSKKITPSDASAVDQFGVSVDLDGDIVVVGADLDTHTGTFGGSAYIFERNLGGPENWGEARKIVPLDGANGEQFGFRVAINQDLVVIGSIGDNSVINDGGSAYLFQKDEGGLGNWGLVKKLTPDDSVDGGFYGGSVDIHSDRVIVGARGDDDLGPDSGSAYIYCKDCGGVNNWGLSQKIIAQDGDTSDRFGVEVAIFEEVVLVGAHLNDDNGPSSGSSYIFGKDEGGICNWGQADKILASDGMSSDLFGISGLLFSNYALISATQDDDHGSVYIFEKSVQCGVDDLVTVIQEEGSVIIDTLDLTISNFGSHDSVYITRSNFNCTDVSNSPLLDSLIGITGIDTTICTFEVTLLDPHGYCCPDVLIVNGNPIDSTDYFASDSICGSGLIETSTSVNFKSTVIKVDSVEVEEGAVFQIINEDCGN